MPGIVWLVHTREAIKNGEDIYRIGYTFNDIEGRIESFPDKSFVVYCGAVRKNKTPYQVCQEVKKVLDKRFKNVSDYGPLHFEGDLNTMVNTMEKIVRKFH